MEDKEDKPPILPLRAEPILPERDQGGSWAPDTPSDAGTKGVFSRLQQNISKINNLYTYSKVSPLTTRLLTIQPRATRPRDIYATLTQVTYEELGESSRYEALSYNWDTDEATETIYIRNDPSTKASIPQLPNLSKEDGIKETVKYYTFREWRVTKNLYQAIQHLRHDDSPIVLWVDAVCINQNDLEEKKTQVAEMNTIYSKAENVLVWLGKGNEETKSTFEFIKEIMKLDRLNTLVAPGPESRERDWRNFLVLMQRPWFSRRWVIQELALARNAVVYCGEDSTHWNNLRDAVSMFALKIDPIRDLFKRSGEFGNDYHIIGEFEAQRARELVPTINNMFRKAEAGRPPEPILGLEYLVSTLSNFNTSDPRDTIHALRNVAKETSRGKARIRRGGATMHRLQPDYTKDLLQVYIEFIKWVEENTGSIDIICRHWALPEREKKVDNYPALVELPSWIQIHSKDTFGRQNETRHRVNGDSFAGLPDQRSYNASHGIDASVKYRIDEMQTPETPRKLKTKSKDRIHPASAIPPANEVAAEEDMHPAAGSSPDSRTETLATAKEFASHLSSLTSQKQSSEARRNVTRSHKKRTADSTGIGGEQQPVKHQRVERLREDSAIGPSKSALDVPVDDRMEPQVNSPLPYGLGNRSNKPLSKEEIEKSLKHREALRRTICVDGLLVGKLNWVTDPIPDGVIPLRVLKTLGLNQREHEPLDKAWQRMKQNPPDKLWRTIVAERGADGRNPPAWYQRACQHCLVNDSTNGHINTKELLTKTQPDWVREFLKRVQAVTWNRVFLEADQISPASVSSNDPSDHGSSSGAHQDQARLGATEEDDEHTEAAVSGIGKEQDNVEESDRDETSTSSEDEEDAQRELEKLHGLGPPDADEGDVVCILFGCSVPCILREKTDELGKHYTFIGEAYIYGLMDGEAVMWKSEKQIQNLKTQFNIR